MLFVKNDRILIITHGIENREQIKEIDYLYELFGKAEHTRSNIVLRFDCLHEMMILNTTFALVFDKLTNNVAITELGKDGFKSFPFALKLKKMTKHNLFSIAYYIMTKIAFRNLFFLEYIENNEHNNEILNF